MQHEEILFIFKETGALLEGHFKLTSGLHSPQYFQCAKVLQYPKKTETLCKQIAEYFKDKSVDVVISPAIGGIVVGQEVGRQLNVRTIFTERHNGIMQLRRGFELLQNENVLICEDVITTGGSTNEVIDIINQNGATVLGIASIVNRSGGNVKFNVAHQFTILNINVITYNPEQCPLCKQNIPLYQPGSRNTN